MKRISIRFRPRRVDWFWGHTTSAPQRALLIVVALASLVLLGVCAAACVTLTREFQATEQAVAARRDARRPRSTKPIVPMSTAQMRSYNDTTNLLNTPWSDVFDTLEDHATAAVALVSIEPDSTRGSIRIEAEAKTLQDLLDYASSLGTSSTFSHVSLVKHEQIDRDPSHPLRLTLEAVLRPHESLPQRTQP